jgi:heme-degrading monooxygenase HmoA
MGEYHLVRVWQLKPGHTGAELEALMASGYLEMQRWIPGVKHVSLLRPGSHSADRYILISTFASYEAYIYWRQVEEEGADYWERYAAIIMQWEQVCSLHEEYAGQMVVDVDIDDNVVS